MLFRDLRMFKFLAAWTVLLVLITGCIGPSGPAAPPDTFTPVTPSAIPTQTLVPPAFTATAVPLPTSTPEPFGCRKPPEDYTKIEVGGTTMNQRTMAMLAHARELYGGELQITGQAITQGSYTDSVSASFGTHQGGGAVDLSVMQPGTYTVLWGDIEPLLHALRVAGFAAWLRDYGELYPDSPIHIHAIAIGDRELSPAAREQLTGLAGYFRGFSGLPIPEGGAPTPDRFGGPLLCQWMIELGYRDLR